MMTLIQLGNNDKTDSSIVTGRLVVCFHDAEIHTHAHGHLGRFVLVAYFLSKILASRIAGSESKVVLFWKNFRFKRMTQFKSD